MTIEFYGPTPNRWVRALNDPRYRIDHTTEGGWAGSVATLMSPAAEVSAHFVVAEDGYTLQLADLHDATWHAGRVSAPRSPLYDGTNPNLVAPGVEFIGTYTRRLTREQLLASNEIDRRIMEAYGLARPLPHAPHSDFATTGAWTRLDPGVENFAAILEAMGWSADMDEREFFDRVVAFLRSDEGGREVTAAIARDLMKSHGWRMLRGGAEPAGTPDTGERGEWPTALGEEPLPEEHPRRAAQKAQAEGEAAQQPAQRRTKARGAKAGTKKRTSKSKK